MRHTGAHGYQIQCPTST